MTNDQTETALDAATDGGIDAQALIEIGRQSAQPHEYLLDRQGDALLVTRVRDDEEVQVVDLETYLPRPARARGTAVVATPDDFVAYVNRLADVATTTVWADDTAGTVTAVLDDHGHHHAPGWRGHTVTLALREDTDWKHWINADRKLVAQQTFAAHIEDALHTIVHPAAADMLEVALSLQASRTAAFKQATRLDNNDVELSFVEETKAKAGANGKLEVPREFRLLLTPWVGCLPIEVVARLRYEIDGGSLRIGYSLVRPDLVRIEVFEGMVGRIGVDLADGIPVYTGKTPSPVRAPR